MKPYGNLPTSTQIFELLEKCEWRPRRIGRSIVGFNVIGPNGNSIYIPFVEVQSSIQRVSKSKWREMEKIIYFASKEEVENPDNLCKCKVDANGASLTTSTVATKLHFRLVSI